MKQFLQKYLYPHFATLRFFLNDEPQKTGALIDTTPEEDRVNFKDIVATASSVKWSTKSMLREFPELNQYQSSSCGANALSKTLGINIAQNYGRYIQLSRRDIYSRRINKPTEGMSTSDMIRIATEGVPLEMLVGGQLLTENDYNQPVTDLLARKEGEVWAVSGGVYIPNDIDLIASIIQVTGKAPVLFTWFTNSEWSKEVPVAEQKLEYYDKRAYRHFVTAVDYTIKSFNKTLYIEDSAHFGGISRRYLTENWVKDRVLMGIYLMNFKYSMKVGDKPTYDGVTVISAQICLKWLGYFPNNISHAETVGPVTRNALAQFQRVNGLKVTQALDADTKKALHKLFP